MEDGTRGSDSTGDDPDNGWSLTSSRLRKSRTLVTVCLLLAVAAHLLPFETCAGFYTGPGPEAPGYGVALLGIVGILGGRFGDFEVVASAAVALSLVLTIHAIVMSLPEARVFRLGTTFGGAGALLLLSLSAVKYLFASRMYLRLEYGFWVAWSLLAVATTGSLFLYLLTPPRKGGDDWLADDLDEHEETD